MIGDLIGTYRIIGGYPAGGMRAVDTVDHTRVHLELAEAGDWREYAIQHLRAASIARALVHPGIARIHGHGVHADRRPYIASELAEGVPLSDVLARRVISVEEAVALLRAVCEVVASAHAQRVLHGAIRPHLVVMRTGDRPFPIQLGGWGDLTAPDSIAPRPASLTAYMAPELVRGRSAIDGAIDVYAIGAIVYRGLTGRFPGMLAPEVVAGVPCELSDLVVRMLALDPAQRPTASAVITAVTQLASDRVHIEPRFPEPRWTPAPLPGSERFANILDIVAARRERS